MDFIQEVFDICDNNNYDSNVKTMENTTLCGFCFKMIPGDSYTVDECEVSFGQQVSRINMTDCCSLNCANSWSRQKHIPTFENSVLELTIQVLGFTEKYKEALTILSETHKMTFTEMDEQRNIYMDEQLEEKTIEEIAIILKCDPTREACMDKLLKHYSSIEDKAKYICLELKIAKADLAFTKGLLARETREILLSKNLKLRNLWGEKLEIAMDANNDRCVGVCSSQIHRAMDDGYINAFCS